MHRVLRGCIRLQNRGYYGKHPGRNGPLTRGENALNAQNGPGCDEPRRAYKEGVSSSSLLAPTTEYAPLNYLARNRSSDEKRLKSEGVL